MESIACSNGMRGSTSAGQVIQKCTSSSTAPLHNLHIFCSAGMPTYLPISISSGTVPGQTLIKIKHAANKEIPIYGPNS